MKEKEILLERVDMVSAEAWAEALNYHCRHVYLLLRSGKLPGRKVLGRWVTPYHEFTEYLYRHGLKPPRKYRRVRY